MVARETERLPLDLGVPSGGTGSERADDLIKRWAKCRRMYANHDSSASDLFTAARFYRLKSAMISALLTG